MTALEAEEPTTTADNVVYTTSAETAVDLCADVESLRWPILVGTCLVMAGVFFSMDLPAALHQNLKEWMGDEDFELYFNLLFTVYSVPNVVLPFFGGALVDSVGASICMIAFSAFCFAGQAIGTVGCQRKQWSLMLLGRVIYGLGGESLCAAYSTLLTRWFAGKELALSFGIALALSRLGSVLNNLISPRLANRFHPPTSLLFGTIMNTISVAMAFLVYVLDSKRERVCTSSRANIVSDDAAVLEEPLLPHEDIDTSDSDSREACGKLRRFSPLFWLLALSCLVTYACILPWNNVASAILLERDLFKAPPVDCRLMHPDECTRGRYQSHLNPSLDAANHSCPPPNYSPVLPTSLNLTDADGKTVYYNDALSATDVDCNDPFWASGCTQDYCQTLERATERAGRVMSIPYTISACMSPLLGGVIDRVGRRAHLALMASLLLAAVHGSLALTSILPALPLAGQGLAYALYASVLWPSVSLTVPADKTGTAFGVITAVQNIGLSLSPLVVATVYNWFHAFIPSVEIFFTLCAGMGTLIGVIVIALDRRSGNRLYSRDGKGDDARDGNAVSNVESEGDTEGLLT